MSSTSEFMAGSPLALSYPEPFRVTGPLPSLVLRTEDVCQRCVCVYYCRTYDKAVCRGEGDSEGHVL